MPGPAIPPPGNVTQPGGGYNLQQLAALWIEAGGDAKQAPTMAAIAMAESTGNPRAHNASGASGLWQILGQPFAGNVYDPLTNAKMAVAKYKSQGLGAWATYTSGAYRQFLQQAKDAASTLPGSIDIPNPLKPITDVAGQVGRFVDLVTSGSFWLRIGEFILGAVALYLGLHALTGQSSTPGQQVKHVTRIIPLPI